jgi:predicted DNA-binding transcriptional regulator AlpA
MKQKQLPLKNSEFTAISSLTKVPVIDPLKRLIDLTWGEVVLELDRRYNSPVSAANHSLAMQGSGVFLNTHECAAITGYTPGYIRQLVFKRDIPFYKSKNRKPVRFKESEILLWMADRKFTPIDELADDYVEKKF